MTTAIDFNSATWKAVKARAEQRLAEARARNDSLSLPPHLTQAERGRIAELKELLGLEPADPTPLELTEPARPYT